MTIAIQVTIPNGIRLITESCVDVSQIIVPQRHTFIITREDGNKVYGMSLLFYVQVLSDRILDFVASCQAGNIMANEAKETSVKSAHKKGINLLLTTRVSGLRSIFLFTYFDLLSDILSSDYLWGNTIVDTQSVYECCSVEYILFTSFIKEITKCIIFREGGRG